MGEIRGINFGNIIPSTGYYLASSFQKFFLPIGFCFASFVANEEKISLLFAK